MTDKDRIRLSTRQGNKVLGPLERQRCQHHPRRWVSYRWTWRVGSTPSMEEPAIVKGCGSCADE